MRSKSPRPHLCLIIRGVAPTYHVCILCVPVASLTIIAAADLPDRGFYRRPGPRDLVLLTFLRIGT